jgi:hypothetical protein
MSGRFEICLDTCNDSEVRRPRLKEEALLEFASANFLTAGPDEYTVSQPPGGEVDAADMDAVEMDPVHTGVRCW